MSHARVEGTVPRCLRGGVLYRNGPGGGRERHLLDRDGVVTRIAFGEAGAVAVTSRRVRTDRRTAARGGCFGGSCLHAPHNASNTNVLYWGGRLLSLYESGHPYELDPHSLETVGRTSLGVFGPLEAVSAHYSIADGGATLVMMATSPCSGRVRFVEFDRGWNKRSDRWVDVGGYRMVHDFAVTPRDYVFVKNGVQLDLCRVLGGSSWAEAVRESGRPSELIRVSRRTGRVACTPLGRQFVFHLACATDDGAVRGVGYDALPSLAGLMHAASDAVPRMIEISAGGAVEAVPGGDMVEFPTARDGVVFAARIGDRRISGLWRSGRAGVEDEGSVWVPGDGDLMLDEPIVGDGPAGSVVMITARHARTGASSLYIVDAAVGRPMRTVAVCDLGAALPPGLHGQFIAGFN